MSDVAFLAFFLSHIWCTWVLCVGSLSVRHLGLSYGVVCVKNCRIIVSGDVLTLVRILLEHVVVGELAVAPIVLGVVHGVLTSHVRQRDGSEAQCGSRIGVARVLS